MPTIISSTKLRNNYGEVSRLVHETGRPVFVTKNGEGDLAVMSIAEYERLTGRQELYRLLEEGEADIRAGRMVPAEEVMTELRGDLANGRI